MCTKLCRLLQCALTHILPERGLGGHPVPAICWAPHKDSSHLIRPQFTVDAEVSWEPLSGLIEPDRIPCSNAWELCRIRHHCSSCDSGVLETTRSHLGYYLFTTEHLSGRAISHWGRFLKVWILLPELYHFLVAGWLRLPPPTICLPISPLSSLLHTPALQKWSLF